MLSLIIYSLYIILKKIPSPLNFFINIKLIYIVDEIKLFIYLTKIDIRTL